MVCCRDIIISLTLLESWVPSKYCPQAVIPFSTASIIAKVFPAVLWAMAFIPWMQSVSMQAILASVSGADDKAMACNCSPTALHPSLSFSPRTSIFSATIWSCRAISSVEFIGAAMVYNDVVNFLQSRLKIDILRERQFYRFFSKLIKTGLELFLYSFKNIML